MRTLGFGRFRMTTAGRPQKLTQQLVALKALLLRGLFWGLTGVDLAFSLLEFSLR